jgi:CRP-like cAMP-binding protein
VPNQLLCLLTEDDRQLLLKECEVVPLASRQILIEADERPEHVFLPTSGVISKLTILSDGGSVESTTIGRDGLVGLSAYLGTQISAARFLVLVPGEALRLRPQRLHAIAEHNKSIHRLLDHYADYLLAVSAQSAACNRLHSVVQRCARWLLRVHDLVDGNEFPLTQESLAQMLGVRRASVSIAAGELQDAGLIKYAYGRVRIKDQLGLEALSCECFAVIRRRYQTMVLDASI